MEDARWGEPAGEAQGLPLLPPGRFARLADEVCGEVFGAQGNACVWHCDPADGVPSGDAFLADLAEMQLFVVPVTTAFLFRPSRARDVELPYALGRHIPVLPLVREAGLGIVGVSLSSGGLALTLDNGAPLRLDLGEFNEDVQRVLAAIIAARGSTS